MIDKALFVDRMADLDQHFYGDRPDNILRDYYDLLNPRLDDADFEEACQRILWERSPRDGFPSAKEIAEAADASGPGAQERAIEQAEIVREEMRDWRRADLDRLDKIGRRALSAVGGIKELALLDREKANWRLKEFRSQYRALAEGEEREAEALPPMSDRGQQIVDDAMAGELEPGADR